jgi:hypothetical protein
MKGISQGISDGGLQNVCLSKITYNLVEKIGEK